ncbi:hypothetical protein LZ31DRAFT_94211 [Colletotrichum somersetense]|nr:hypothetical protein LZ31DRAFT_94211 [Colletotrichum somersetense]
MAITWGQTRYGGCCMIKWYIRMVVMCGYGYIGYIRVLLKGLMGMDLCIFLVVTGETKKAQAGILHPTKPTIS